jgi:hypothetical protein
MFGEPRLREDSVLRAVRLQLIVIAPAFAAFAHWRYDGWHGIL